MPRIVKKKPTKRAEKQEKTVKQVSPYLTYAEDIISGRIISCQWVRMACERFRCDLQHQKETGLRFDPEAADRAIGFFGFLKHSKGEWAGHPFELAPWEQFIISQLFGWKRPDGYRRFRTGYISVARKNGKTTLMAGIGLLLFGFDDEAGAEVYTGATKRDQARISHSEATRMVKSSPSLQKRISIYKDNLHIEATASKFEPLGADADTMDGLNVHGALIDELHAHKTRDLWDVLETATGARRQPLQLAITTAGYDRHSICYEQDQYTQKILQRVIEDETFFGIIYGLDEDDKEAWDNEDLWIKANPNLGVSVKLDDLQRKAQKAKEVPTQLNSFLRLHMNVWTESVTRWISVEKWRECGTVKYTEADLKGCTCYGGLDLSSTTDTSSLVLVFPPVDSLDNIYRILCRCFIPAENMRDRVRRDRVPYDVWAKQGHVTATPGNVIDYAFILHQLDQDAKHFDIREMAFDRWGATKVIQDLQAMGFEEESQKHATRHLIDFGQGFASMSAPTKELEKMVLSREIAHGDNPVLTWMISNAVVRLDPAGNMKPDKEKSVERIDLVVALIMALDRALRNKGANTAPLISFI